MAQIRVGVRVHGRLRRLYGTLRLSHRRRHQPGLRQPQSRRHRHARLHHRRAIHRQGHRHLRAKRFAFADRQPHRRQQPARRLRQAAQRRHRLFLRPAFDRIHRPPDRRRDGGDAGHQPADHVGRPRRPVADRPDHGDGGAGPADVILQLHRGAAGLLCAAQADPPHLCHRAQPVPRRHADHGDAAGDAARHPHRQGLHPRRRDARALRPQRRRSRARGEQDGARRQPRQPADGEPRRHCHCAGRHLWRLSRHRNRRDARPVFLVYHSLPARLRAGQAPGAAQYRAQQRSRRRAYSLRGSGTRRRASQPTIWRRPCR